MMDLMDDGAGRGRRAQLGQPPASEAGEKRERSARESHYVWYPRDLTPCRINTTDSFVENHLALHKPTFQRLTKFQSRDNPTDNSSDREAE